jgi:hypothetical protein
MNKKRFTDLAKSKYPNIEVFAHGSYGGLATEQSVAVIFEQGGKTYDYRGSYTQILESLGIVRKWFVSCNDSDIEGRFYTQTEAQACAEKRNTENRNYIQMATQNGYYIPAEKTFIVKETT